MSMIQTIVQPTEPSTPYARQTMLDGHPARVMCIDITGQTFIIRRNMISTISLDEEWYEDLVDPSAAVDTLKRASPADLFTFWQRMPNLKVQHDFHVEWEELAVLSIQSYEHWWKHQINPKTRNRIRKAEKEGLIVKEVPFDDDFVEGMTAIFNESPIRQGRHFPHYGKIFDTVKTQFSRNIHRERMIGAYLEGELIGLIMLTNAGQFGLTGQVISSLKHRDKSPNNAFIAKAVEVCASAGLPHLVYAFWSNDSLSEFKRHCGFEPVRVPRYWVALTWKGRLALKLGLHRCWKAILPADLRVRLKDWRRRWYERRVLIDRLGIPLAVRV